MAERAGLDQFAQRVAISRRAERRGERLGLLTKLFEFGAGNGALEYGQRRAQPPQRDAHLVDRLRVVALAQGRPIGDVMFAGAGDEARDRLVENDVGLQGGRARLGRNRRRSLGEVEGALRLADDIEDERQAFGEVCAEFIERARRAGFQLQLQFAQGPAAFPDKDDALVESRLDPRRAMLDESRHAPDAGFVFRLEFGFRR